MRPDKSCFSPDDTSGKLQGPARATFLTAGCLRTRNLTWPASSGVSIWQDEEFEILDKQGNPAIFPGLKGKVIKLSDGLAPYILDGRDTAVLPWALVEFENGHLATVDLEVKWKKVLDG